MAAYKGRREDDRFLTGQGRYTGDWSLPGELHAAFRRSEVAAARIRSLDISEALRQPGVQAVLLGSDFSRSFGTLVPAINYRGRGGAEVITPERPLLAREHVRFVGEEIALVLADSRAAALDAAEKISVDYEERPAVIGWAAALRGYIARGDVVGAGVAPHGGERLVASGAVDAALHDARELRLVLHALRARRQLLGGNYLNVVWSKAYPGFCPIGPCVVVDEIDPDDVEVSCTVNGSLRQRENPRLHLRHGEPDFLDQPDHAA